MNEIIESPPRASESMTTLPAVQAGPLAMAMQAMRAGMSIEDMRGMLDLQKDFEANEARKAYVDAVASFKLDPPIVYKDKDNLQYKSKYTSIGNLVNTVNSALSKHGLSASWQVDQTTQIKVTCILTHKLGHSESCSMSGPADASGAKNPLQQIKSTVTYLKLATYEAITGTASAEGNADDDGNGAGVPDARLDLYTLKAVAASTMEELHAVYNEAKTTFKAHPNVDAWNSLKAAIADRKAVLEGGSK